MDLPLLETDEESLRPSATASSSRRSNLTFWDMPSLPGPEPEFPRLPMTCRECVGAAFYLLMCFFYWIFVVPSPATEHRTMFFIAFLRMFSILFFIFFLVFVNYIYFQRTDPITFVTKHVATAKFLFGEKGRVTCAARFKLGVVHEILGETEKALECYQEIVKLETRCNSHPAGAPFHYKIGATLLRLGRYSEALESFHAAVRLRKLTTNVCRISRDLHQIAFVHEKLGDYEDALKYHKEALEVLRAKQTQNIQVAKSLTMVAKIYNAMGNSDEALKSLNEALEIHLLNEGDFPRSLSVARLHGQIADMEQKRGNNPAALENFRLALEVYRRGGWSDEHREVSRMLRKASEVENASVV